MISATCSASGRYARSPRDPVVSLPRPRIRETKTDGTAQRQAGKAIAPGYAIPEAPQLNYIYQAQRYLSGQHNGGRPQDVAPRVAGRPRLG